MTNENLQDGALPETEKGKPETQVSGRDGLGVAVDKVRKRKYTKSKPAEVIPPPCMTFDQATAATKLLMASMIKPPLSMLAKAHDEAAQKYGFPGYTFAMGEDEEMALSFAMVAAFQTIPPNFMGKWLPWIALAITAGTIGGTRVMVAMKINKAAKENHGNDCIVSTNPIETNNLNNNNG
jgi:hypothetical protein